MKYYPLLFLILLTAQVHAQEDTEAVAQADTGTQLTSPSSYQQRADFLRFSTMLKRVTAGATNVSEMMKDMATGQAAVCSKFVGQNEFGPWGKLIKNELDKTTMKALYGIKDDPDHQGPKDLVKLCPNYPTMIEADKDALWNLIVGMMSFKESSCQEGERKSDAPHGTAYGLLQLHKNHEAIYSPGCQNGDSLQPARTLRCGLAMMNDQVNREGNIFSQKSYWATLRPVTTDEAPYSRKIMKAVCKFEACGQEMNLCERQLDALPGIRIARSVSLSTKVRTASVHGRSAQ